MKIRYIDKDDMRLVVGAGNPELIKEGDIKEFSEEMANSFLRDLKTILVEKKKAKTDKDGNIITPAEYEVKKIPKWELVKEKSEKEEK